MINMLESVYRNNSTEVNNGISNAANLSQSDFSAVLQEQMSDTLETPSVEDEGVELEEFLPSTNTNVVASDTNSSTTSTSADTSSIISTMMKLMSSSMSMSTMSMLNGSSSGNDSMSSMMSMLMMVLLMQTMNSSESDETSSANALEASSAYSTAQLTGTMEEKAAIYQDIISAASDKYSVATSLIKGIIQAESSFNSSCVSSAGAQGLMQLMPSTASGLGVSDSFDPEQNIDGGTNYISQMIERYNGDVKLALVAYNCGPGRVAQSGVTSSADANYSSLPKAARDYADKVMAYADNYAAAETKTVLA